MARFLIVLLPILGAMAIAISRTEDYRHDMYDVTAGSIIGVIIAMFSYTRYFPSIFSPIADHPYPSRNSEDKGKEGFEALQSPDLELGELSPLNGQ